MTSLPPSSDPAAAGQEIFVLGASREVDGDDRRRWPGIGSSLWVLASVLVLFMTGGGVALAGGTVAPPYAPPAATAELHQLVPGVIRLESATWTQVAKGTGRQLLVTYRSRTAGPSHTALLARRSGGKRWAAVYTGSRLTSDVLVPSGSALEGNVALGLIGAIDRMSHGTYDVAASPANVALLEVWMTHEGGLWANNPLNTSLDASAYPHEITTGGQDTGIPIYPNLSIGIVHTAQTLLGNPAYTSILKVLAGGSGSCIAFGTAVVQSPWAESHYGHDVGSFCPPGQTPSLTVHTRVAPHGVHRPVVSSGTRNSPQNHSSRVSSTQGRSTTTSSVSGAPAIRGGG